MATSNDGGLWPRYLRVSCEGGSSIAILDAFRRPAFSFRMGREAAIAVLHPEGIGTAFDLTAVRATRLVPLAADGYLEVRSPREVVLWIRGQQFGVRCDARRVVVRLPDGGEVVRRVQSLRVRVCGGECSHEAHGEAAFSSPRDGCPQAAREVRVAGTLTVPRPPPGAMRLEPGASRTLATCAAAAALFGAAARTVDDCDVAGALQRRDFLAAAGDAAVVSSVLVTCYELVGYRTERRTPTVTAASERRVEGPQIERIADARLLR
ncbi:MAG: hypothetical protein GIW95_02535 [Candidatus Eremiobacteraeota bacterium]|nr:hypothetical protein [Candidatus Eremiobacteraeota bacterium]